MVKPQNVFSGVDVLSGCLPAWDNCRVIHRFRVSYQQRPKFPIGLYANGRGAFVVAVKYDRLGFFPSIKTSRIPLPVIVPVDDKGDHIVPRGQVSERNIALVVSNLVYRVVSIEESYYIVVFSGLHLCNDSAGVIAPKDGGLYLGSRG